MRRCALLAALVVFMVVLSGCSFYRSPVIPPVGGLFSMNQAPLGTEPQGRPVSTKQGEASVSTVLGLVSWGDCGLQAAARDGNLTTIEYCDYKYLNVLLGLYQRMTVVAYGQ